MGSNPLTDIQSHGQSIWLDDIRRGMMIGGEMQRLVAEDGLRGVTSNPAIFDKAISGTEDYDGFIASLAWEGKSVEAIYRALTVKDVQMAADVFRPLYDDSGGDHGFVSLEVNPHLAYRTQNTIEEARELWRALDRPNVFIKVPATPEGLPAIQQLISEGINVNVTLLFGLSRYRRVAEAYIAGLAQRVALGQPIDGIRSVASFFLSRIDVLVDPQLEELMAGGGSEARLAEDLHGQVAIDSAKQAYQIYKEVFHNPRFRKLADQGARPQRVLWASTSTKNPDYPDVKYVEALIGPETVNTLPSRTLKAYRDHGEPASRLEEGVAESRARLENLAQVGIDLHQATRQLEQEGVAKFNRPFDNLLRTLADERGRFRAQPPGTQRFAWGVYGRSIVRRLAALEDADFVSRLWRRDPGLWVDEEDQRRTIAKALGWLQAPTKVLQTVGDLLLFAREVKAAGFRQVVHMGMGGSSLAPMVFQRSFAPGDGGLPLTVLDATDPGAVAAASAPAPPEKTLYIAASKSGTTTEAVDFMEYAYAKVRQVKGDRAGENFVVITDPGTPLAATACERGFRRLFVNFADVGGRYSALTLFGLVPAALMGLDIETLLARALRMRQACGSATPALANPGLMLGCVLGEMALQGRNKVTFVMPEAVATLGMWLEQLLAESTGKEGTGLLPVAGEALAAPEVYGSDRVFVHVRLGEDDAPTRDRLAALRDAGHPVVTIRMADRYDLAQEFYRWEIAVAAAGAVIGVNVFNQPNVQESKDNTRAILKELRESGSLPEGKPDLVAEAIAVYGCPQARDLEDALAAFFQTAAPGDYCALLAYIQEDDVHTAALTRNLRDPLQRQLKLATTLGYGPRYLHSTGQLHKGGPNSGLYLMFTTDAPEDIAVPERPYRFGELRLAQAIGDLQALQKHGRRVLRFHLGSDVAADLNRIGKALQSVLSRLKA